MTRMYLFLWLLSFLTASHKNYNNFLNSKVPFKKTLVKCFLNSKTYSLPFHPHLNVSEIWVNFTVFLLFLFFFLLKKCLLHLWSILNQKCLRIGEMSYEQTSLERSSFMSQKMLLHVYIWAIIQLIQRASEVALVVKNLPASAGDRRDVGSITEHIHTHS